MFFFCRCCFFNLVFMTRLKKNLPSGFRGLHRSKSTSWFHAKQDEKKHLGLLSAVEAEWQSIHPYIHYLTPLILFRLAFMPFQGPADNWAMVEDTLDKSPVHHSSSQGRSVNMKVKLKCNGRCFRKERRMLNVKLITRLPDNSRKLTERKSLYSRMRINPKLYVSCLSIKPP